MIMRQQDDVDFWHIVEGDAGRIGAPGSGKSKRAGAVGPNRVGDNVVAGRLDEQGCVADHPDREAVAANPFGRPCILKRAWPRGRPFLPPVGKAPGQQVAQSAWGRSARIEKDVTVEMVRNGPGIITVFIGYLANAMPGVGLFHFDAFG